MDAALRECESRFRRVVEAAPMGIHLYRLDPEGRLLLEGANPAADAILGVDHGAFAGRPIEEAFPGLADTEILRQYRRVCEDGEAWQAEELAYRDERIQGYFEVHAFRTAPGEMMVMFRDVSERHRAEEAIRRLNAELEDRVRARTADLELAYRELESFNYSVSHDLRAPLRTIDGFSLAVLEDFGDRLDDTGRGYLERVRAATRRMSSLIDDLLILSRTTRQEMCREPVDLSAMAREIGGEMGRGGHGRRVDLHVQAGLVAQADARLLRLALTNLLDNAWKFTGRRPDARVELVRRADGVYLVRDNGAGFDMGYAHKLFAPFQRLHSADEFPGTGIGLAIVQRVVHRHGGRVWAEASPGAGATFFFTLPPAAGEAP